MCSTTAGLSVVDELVGFGGLLRKIMNIPDTHKCNEKRVDGSITLGWFLSETGIIDWEADSLCAVDYPS